MRNTVLLAALGALDIAILVVVIIFAVGAGLYFLNRWASNRYAGQKAVIDKNKQVAQIYVIDKRHDYSKNVNLPKQVQSSLPKLSKYIKMYFVQAKIGPQIATLMTDKSVYRMIAPKKTLKVDLAGVYIVGVRGAKPPEEIKKARREKAKAEKETAKAARKAARGAKK